MSRIRGRLLSTTPYTIVNNGRSNSVRTVISPLAKLQRGDRYYQEELPNGCILLIPEELYNETLDENMEKA